MSIRDDETLIRLRKALESRGTTDYVKEAWQERLTRKASVPGDALQASEVISGLAGSWAGSLSRSYQATREPGPSNPDKSGSTATSFPHDAGKVESRLGREGPPEINFRPYDAGSHRFGPKGPSLLGHPIAFSILGPTKASPHTDWQWTVNTAGANDTLTMANGPGGSSSAANLAEGYNLSGTGISFYNGGLYLVITDTGAEDGRVAAGTDALTPLAKYVGTAQFEIFRVLSYDNNQLVLASEKRLSSVFNIPATPVVRAITLMQPNVTRLVAMPGSGPAVGRERIFAVVPPETAASSGWYPPYKVWQDGGFEATSTAGEVTTYGGQFNLPVPTALRTMQGEVEKGGGTPADGPGFWRITGIAGAPVVSADQGKIVQVTEVNLLDGATLSHGDVNSLLGFYEINENIGNDGYQLKRLPEVNPATGRFFYGPGPYFDTTGHTGAAKVQVTITLHDKVGSVFEGGFNLDAVEAARLTNIIDPEWVERSVKINAASTVPSGGNPGRADRSIFNTESGTGMADPGSLLDLGFRMVLFPAKAGPGGIAVADFSKPIAGRDITIDPAITTEPQFWEVDYSSGLVYLSHAPPINGGGAVVPNGVIAGSNNPRLETVLFAACVPYSREAGQTGVSVRVTGGALESADLGYEDKTPQDVFGGRVHANLNAHAAGSNPHDMTVTGTNSASWPLTGSAEVLFESDSPLGLSQGTISWVDIGNVTSTTFDLMGVSTDASIPFTVPATVVLRRSDDDIRLDTTYGSKWRTPVWRMAYANLTAEPDGSLTVMPTAVEGPAQELRASFPLGGSTEVARMFLETDTNRWTTTAPPWSAAADDNDIGFEVTRGRLFTSMALDFTAGETTFSRFLNRGTSATSIQAKPTPDLATPSNRFELAIDTTGGVFDAALPASVPGLCAVVEGSSIATKESGSWASISGGDRLLLDIKVYDRAGLNSLVNREYAEAPANPLNWFAFEAVGGDSPTSIKTAINNHYSGQTPAMNPALVEGTGPAQRVLLTERQVRILPSRFYLESDVISVGTPFICGVDSSLMLSVFSADPKNSNGGKWIAVQLLMGTLNSGDPDEVAAHLNRTLYDPNLANCIQGELNNAGFFATPIGVAASPNPYLNNTYTPPSVPALVAAVGERQFLFVGPQDPRHPTGAETVALICGGWGSSLLKPTARDFFNVMVEVGRANPAGTKDVAAVLGGDFDPNPYVIPSCGLFFGDHANDTPAAPGTGAFSTGDVQGLVNEDVGFHKSGVRPLGALVGSHRVVQALSGPVRAVIDLSKGHGSDWYAGPQRTSTFEYDQNVSPPTSPAPATGTKLTESGYLGRWVWGTDDLTVIDRTVATTAGIADIWISYTLKPFGETGFVCPLTASIQQGYESFLAKFVGDAAAFAAPKVSLGDISSGDIIVGTVNATTLGFEGRLLSWDSSTRTAQAMLVSRGTFNATHGHLVSQGLQPTTFGAFDPLSNPTVNTLIVSLVPRPGFGKVASAFRSLVQNAAGISTTNSTDEYGQGLDGGSTTSGLSHTFSGVSVAGGRIDLVSLIGPSAAPGVSFTNPVLGEGLGVNPHDVTTTFLESGVFTTTVALGNQNHAQLDSGGLFDMEDTLQEYGPYGGTRGLHKGQSDGGAHVGGVGGLRVSGDAQVWLRNPRPLKSDLPTAFIREQPDMAAAPLNVMGVGPSVPAGYETGSGHTPSGFGSARRIGGGAGAMILQEATVSLGLTRADMSAFVVASGNKEFPLTGDEVINATPDATSSFVMAQWALTPDIPVLMPFLTGMYLKLGDATGAGTDNANDGTWRIVGAPAMTISGLTTHLKNEMPGLVTLLADQGGRPIDITKHGHGAPSTSSVVAVLQVRVERYAVPPSDRASGTAESFVPETFSVPSIDGHPWGIYADISTLDLVYVADVVDPGGSPTGAPRSLHGMTLDPASLGVEDLQMEMIPVFRPGPGSGRWPMPGPARLLGIRVSEDNKGRVTSHAWFSWVGTPAAHTNPNVYARAVIHSTSRSDGLDDLSSATTQGEFAVDRSGRVSFVGHPRRLGPGVLLDGGLGLVMANAFRAIPKPVDMDQLAGLSVVGQSAAWPLSSYTRQATGSATSIPSSFNTVEFFEDTTIVGPGGSLQFEDARAAQGLPFRIKENAVAASSFAGPAQRLLARTTPDDVSTSDHPKIAVLPNDSLFPAPWSGIRFRSPGTVRYERPFRTIDARGGPQGLTALNGPSSSGIRGIETPTFGECLLLPKGPPTERGSGTPNWRANDAVGDTPLDTPLYEFRGSWGGVTTSAFPISPWDAFTGPEQGKGGDKTVGPTNHKGTPGVVSQAYRHSRSRGDLTAYPGEGSGEQLRILDGMVIEDVTNGSFFTAGFLGRDFAYTNINIAGLELGDGTRGPINGSLTVAHGGGGNEAEIIYDLGPYLNIGDDPKANTVAGVSNGFGDRVDSVTVVVGGSPAAVEQVRRPLVGHKYRVTPNVEFVPILGPRGVGGGLLPPLTDPTDPATTIEGADAVFYSMNHSFAAPGGNFGAGDVGRMLYICGTYTYKYTGWWVILDVIPNYEVLAATPNEFDGTGANVALTTNVAVLRKLKRVGHSSGDSETFEGALPLVPRSPRVEASANHLTNQGMMSGTNTDWGDIQLWITDNAGALFYDSGTVTPTPASTYDLPQMRDWLNATAAFNGLANGPVQFIIWSSNGTSLECRYDLTLLNAAQKAALTGHLACLRVAWQSRVAGGYTATPAGPNARNPMSIGFHTYPGHSAQSDRGAGDKNNALAIVDNSQHLAHSAASGIRWVFSAPLTAEHVGSYLHLTKPAVYRFNTLLTSQTNAGSSITGGVYPLVSGNPQPGDQINEKVDIFRINRCPTTADLVVGGDCEEYYTELIKVGESTAGSVDDSGLGRPVLYSPLGVYGFWPDTVTDTLSPRGHNLPMRYALQPIARERIVTISPNSMRSNTWVAEGVGGGGTADKGTGPRIKVDPTTGVGFDLSKPWQLMDRAMVGGRTAKDWNANATKEYTWAPGAEWWQLYVPAPGQQVSEEDPPPTLRVDLTDAFTQAAQPGGGISSPYPGKQPKGARLTRIWVNFGVWGNDLQGRASADMPGYLGTAGDVRSVNHMTFNLIVELPGSHAREFDPGATHPWASGPGVSPFGGRAPTAIYNHASNKDTHVAGGTVVVPLYCNREAGDLMPNVMERWVSTGPSSLAVTSTDWRMGDPEYGFGCSSVSPYNDLINNNMFHNAHNPVLWGGIDFKASPFLATREFSLALATPMPRDSKVSGGIRSPFTSGLYADLGVFTGTSFESLSPSTLTGLVITHGAAHPLPPGDEAGTTANVPTTCPHAFTIALTPVGDSFDPTATTAIRRFGRQLETGSTQPGDRPFKVGNWLDNILDHYGIVAPSGSMLPPGARVLLEISTSIGKINHKSSAGTWVGSVKCAFEVETGDGTAYVENVNHLGNDR